MKTAFFKDIEPVVICIGVRKAATTWLHRQLEAHPEVGCTITKEVGYWGSNYAQGEKWYVDQFPKGEFKVYAEVTPHYTNEKFFLRMSENLSGVRFILILRNPFERAWSAYLHKVRNGYQDSFFSAIDQYPKIIEHSKYAAIIKKYIKFFSLDDLLILFFEDIQTTPEVTMKKVYAFLGVDTFFVPESVRKPVNIGRRENSFDLVLTEIQRLVKKIGVQRKHLQALGLDKKIDNYFNFLAKKNPKPKLKKKERELLVNYFADDIVELEKLIGKDLSHWK